MYLVITIVIFVILVRILPVALNYFDAKRGGDKDGVEDAKEDAVEGLKTFIGAVVMTLVLILLALWLDTP